VAAFHGPLGELVSIIDPHTEADPAAIHFQALVGFGNMIGRSGYHQHEADHHYTNEYLVLVGDTSDGRKGTSFGHVLRTLTAVDPSWVQSRITPGLSSGEGLLNEVRDSHKDDAGVSDKRLLVFEPEFANVLRVFERTGNTLSALLRSAWEGRPLRVLVKNNPARCNAPHISLIGHITGDELRKFLTATDAANGLANRHLFVLVERSKFLPHGGENFNPADLEPVEYQMRLALEFARGLSRIHRTDDARSYWESIYPSLSAGRPGVAGAITARALAHVTRLSLIYAVLDHSDVVTAAHLQAALACWEYAAASVLYVFGDSTGNSTADDIRAALNEAGQPGITRTDISGLFGRNKHRAEIDRALELLRKIGAAECMRAATAGRGRHVVRRPHGRIIRALLLRLLRLFRVCKRERSERNGKGKETYEVRNKRTNSDVGKVAFRPAGPGPQSG
jgi:hypothetical protein